MGRGSLLKASGVLECSLVKGAMCEVLVSFPVRMKAVAQKRKLCQVKPKLVRGSDICH